MSKPLLHEALHEKLLDVRVLERNVERGLVSPEKVQESVKKLSDDAVQAEWVKTDTVTNGSRQ